MFLCRVLELPHKKNRGGLGPCGSCGCDEIVGQKWRSFKDYGHQRGWPFGVGGWAVWGITAAWLKLEKVPK